MLRPGQPLSKGWSILHRWAINYATYTLLIRPQPESTAIMDKARGHNQTNSKLMNKKLRFMWMLLLTAVCATTWAEKLDDSRADEYQKVTFSASTDESETNVLTKGGITLTLSTGNWKVADSFGGTVGWEFAPGTTVTITGGDIVKIPLTFTGVQWGDPDPFTYEGNGTDGLWGFKNNWYWRSETDGEHQSVTFTVNSDCKLKEFEVWTVGSGQQTVAAPVIEGESFFDESTTVSITAEDGADIYYTLDYNYPTAASTKYTGPFTITETTRVMAIAVKDGINSEIARRDFTKRETTAKAPEIEGETPFTDRTTVTITSEQARDQIYYTIDGTTPNAASLPYTGPFTLIATTTVKAMYVRNGGPSEIAEKTFVKEGEINPDLYTIAQLAEEKRNINNITLQLNQAQVVYGEAGADGSVRVVREGNKAIDLLNTDLALPVGTVLTGTVKLDVQYQNGVLTATDIAGETNEAQLQKTHNGNYDLGPVTVTPSQIAAYAGDLIRLENVTIGASRGVYTATATENGTTYTVLVANGEAYSMKDGQTGNLTAFFYAAGTDGYVANVRAASFEQEYNAPAAPVIEGDEEFEESTIISMTSEEGTTIHYTLDGSNPTTLSPLYTRPFTITETTTVKALAERNELASPMVEKTFTKKSDLEWRETTLAEVAAQKQSVPRAVLTLEDALVCFTPNYGKTWVVRDGDNAFAWLTKQSLATNYEYYGTVRVKIDYNNGFITVSDIDGETNLNNIEVVSHYGDWDYHFTNCSWDEIEAGQHKGDFIMIKHVKVVKEQDENGDNQYYAGEGENRIWLDNPTDFAYYYNEDPNETHDVGGWYRAEREMFVARLRLGVGNPTILGDEVFAESTYVTIERDNELDDVYYTLDGEDPDLEYEGTHNYIRPFRIDQSCVVKAVSRRYEGESDIIEKTFTKDVTGITAAQTQATDTDTQTYNMAGQRVGKGYKGIVIEKGHKVVRK